MDKYIGKMLENRYEIEEVIGVGGMAVVYKAKCNRLNRNVALKILKDEYAVDEDFRRRFYDESQAVAMLSHPNIVNVYDVSKTDDMEYIVMELIDGITLKEYMHKRKQLSWKEITFFSIQIAKALEHAHSRGIIHRDIKPQNIMLLRDGTVKVADFGIARHVSDQETYSMGEAIGSVHYVSPEQARGSFIDNRADIYSLGVVMYEMITGRLPFEGDTPISVAIQHINSIALPPSDFTPDVPKGLESITLKAMNPSLTSRYTSATEMLQDLEKFRDDPNFMLSVPIGPIIEDTEKKPESSEVSTIRLNNTGEVDLALAREKKKKVKREKSAKSGFSTSIIFSILAVVILVGGGYFFITTVLPWMNNDSSSKVSVPEFRNKYFSDIKADSMYDDWVFVEQEAIYDDIKAEGIIIDQSPASGSRVEPGTTIYLTVSKGPQSISLRDYAGWELQYVQADFTKNGLDPVLVEETNEEYDEGFVIRTDPAATSSVLPGSKIIIYVSKGKEVQQILVPSLVGMTREEAEAALHDVGLLLGTVDEIEHEEGDDRIFFQWIPADSMVDEGTAINVSLRKLSEQAANQGSGNSGTGQKPNESNKPSTPEDNRTSDGGIRTSDGGIRYIPDAYSNQTNLLVHEYMVYLAELDSSVEVKVYVDSYVQYEGTHDSSKETITVTLAAPKGDRRIRVYFGDELVVDDKLSFK